MEQDIRDFSRKIDWLLTRLNRQRKQYMAEELKPYELVGSMHMFITTIDAHPGMCQDDLCNRFCLEKCTVSKRIKRLEELQYITREVDQEDKRKVKLYLTEEGHRLVPIIWGLLEDWNRKLTEGMSTEECKATTVVLEHMSERARQMFPKESCCKNACDKNTEKTE